MTKKDYTAIAAAIRSVRDSGEANQLTLRAIVQALGNTLAQVNPRFEHFSFAFACTGIVDLSGTDYLARIGAR